MMLVYLGLLLLGGGVIGVQLLIGHDADADGAGDEVHTEGDAAGAGALFLSLRFWSFACLAAGLCGTLCLAFGVLSGPWLAALAAGLGLGCGAATTLALRALGRASHTSPLGGSGLVGQTGRVLLPPQGQGQGKVRLLVGGHTIDLLASSQDEALSRGEEVIVVAVQGAQVEVARAGLPLLEPPKKEPDLGSGRGAKRAPNRARYARLGRMENSTAGAGALIFAALLVLLVVFAALAVLLPMLLYICKPNEILIFSGRRHRLADGSVVGFKVLHGGRGFRVPLLETVSRMDVRLLPVELSISNVYSKGGIPLTLQAIANVKVSTAPALVHNAVERFLGATPDQIEAVSRQTLEGVLREVLSQLTPEEVNQDRLKFAETLMAHARDDFDKLGIELDVLKVQHVSDEQQYLANLGRARIAGMIRDAQNAENQANQVVSERQAAARQRAETARKQAEAIILQKKNQMRAELARLDAEANSIENEAKVAAETARMVAEQELQQARAELAQLRLQCETVLPAEAARQAQEAHAAGDASPIVENGKAAAEALRLVAERWREAGAAGREIYVLQQLPALAEAAIGRVSQTEIAEATVVEGDASGGYAAVAASHPLAVARVLRETARAVGVDLDALLASSAGGAS